MAGVCHARCHVLLSKEEVNRDKQGDSDAFMRELETRFFQTAQEPDGSRPVEAVDAVLASLKSNLGFTTGLCMELKRSLARTPCRFWIVDNSGSMRTRASSSRGLATPTAAGTRCARHKVAVVLV